MTPFNRAHLRSRMDRPLVDVMHIYLAEELLDRLTFVKRNFDKGLVSGRLSPDLRAIFDDADPRFTFAAPAIEGGCADVVADVVQPFRHAFPLAISMNDLHLGEDPVRMLTEMRGALVPDGLFLGAATAAGTLAELSESLLAAESALTGGASMRMAPLADMRRWGDALARAGFALPVVDEVRVTLRYSSLASLFADLRGMGQRGVLAERAPAPRQLFARTEAHYREAFSDPDGKLRATFVFACLSGWAPDASQQKPARRGSATMRLEDALKASGG
ncbi:SAM-dependent methyltransferase [Acuticoccus sp. MNP-M23]|uniref:SAM-dependent methyltransferase n=1 Tax=Acuticoccus sp. MNP-M23 TaxID=3072793 RepID=UPI002814BA1C|nr:SAM-dependent methyltransferase [Acuticoccus sp. MNP-M23]WMS42845.1 SAM-dependent methyltransferase [Acuticoccus sp. MNP-M23]